jgi:hypothetical protein
MHSNNIFINHVNVVEPYSAVDSSLIIEDQFTSLHIDNSNASETDEKKYPKCPNSDQLGWEMYTGAYHLAVILSNNVILCAVLYCRAIGIFTEAISWEVQ